MKAQGRKDELTLSNRVAYFELRVAELGQYQPFDPRSDLGWLIQALDRSKNLP